MLWVGPGTYRIDRHLTVDRVTITGAGSWYSVLHGNGVGLYGRKASTDVHLAHFAILGEVRERNDRAKLAAIGGTLGGGSTIDDLWLQHHKSGVWLDGPSSGVTIRDAADFDNTADGINLRRGVRQARIENAFVRNSGDDGIAFWSILPQTPMTQSITTPSSRRSSPTASRFTAAETFACRIIW